MAYRKNGIKKILAQFIKETKKKMPVEKVILFGSYANGTSRKYSDVDIAVISPKFAHMNEFERIKLLLDCAHQIKYESPVDLETFGYTPQEYEDASRFDFLGVIKNTGKVVYPS
jgi:predicted nucleotidyltransferase